MRVCWGASAAQRPVLQRRFGLRGPQVVAFRRRCTADCFDVFVGNVSGEWEGVTATFHGTTGQPLPLPEIYVPQAYRDWGVAITDWQTTCSSKASAGPSYLASSTPGAQPDPASAPEQLEHGLAPASGKTTPQDPSASSAAADGSQHPSALPSVEIKHMVRRMMPTVGCEADAVAFTEESGVLRTVGLGTVGASLGATTSGGSEDGGSGGNDNIHGSGGVVLAGSGRVIKEPWLALLATEEDGSYIAGPDLLPTNITPAGRPALRTEVCVALPGSNTARQRVRLVLHASPTAAAPQEGGNLASSGQPGMWSAHSVEVHIERWLRDYTGALDLCGCGGGLSAFASTFVTRPVAGVELDDDGIATDAPWSQLRQPQLPLGAVWSMQPTPNHPGSLDIVLGLLLPAPPSPIPLAPAATAGIGTGAGVSSSPTPGLQAQGSEEGGAQPRVLLGVCMYDQRGRVVGCHFRKGRLRQAGV